MQESLETVFGLQKGRISGYDFLAFIERIAMHGLRFSWSRTPFQAAIVLALAGVSLAGLPAQAHGQAAGATAAVPAKVLPGDDFYDYVNGDWLRGTQIPADRSSWGSFAILADATNERIIGLVEGLAAAPQAEASARQVSDFYRSWMDEAAIEAKGWAPIKPLLSKINGIRDQAGLARALGESLRADVDPLNATNFYTENLFGLWVAQDLNDTTRMQGLRTGYQAHIAAMLRQAGYSDAAGRAARVFALEQQIAASHASREDSADVAKGNNAWRAATLGCGVGWRSKAREAAARQQILTDGHAPAQYRAATVRNLDAWYRAFDVQPGQQLYLAPQQRVRVW
jgi:putative endopeptidase